LINKLDKGGIGITEVDTFILSIKNKMDNTSTRSFQSKLETCSKDVL